MNALYNLSLILTLFVTLGKSLHVKILVVEDEVITARVIAEELTALGYIVTDTVTSDELVS